MRTFKSLAWRAIQSLKLERIVIVLRACALVNEPVVIALGEMRRRRGSVRRFTLRHSGHAVYLRSRSTDLNVLHEVFSYRGYDPPAQARIALSRRPVAVDAGANIGLFTLFLCESVPGVKVTAFEPDSENVAIARRTLAPLIQSGQVELLEVAVGTCAGEIPFVAGRAMTSHRAVAGEPGTVRVRQVDVFEHLNGVGLLKLDIEGAEWDILRDPRWSDRMPPSVVMEWHGVHDNQREPDPLEELKHLLSAAQVVQHTPFVPGVVGHLWAFR
ncbi:MAG: FkbM family methyltransferase [Solirubrobacteraceae bacterium]